MKSARILRLIGCLSLSLRAAVPAAALVASAALLSACADEADARTWVKRLDDPKTRPEAVKRLTKFFDDAMAKANKNREDPQIKELLDEIVTPFSTQYLSGTADDATRADLARVLAESHDARSFPALAKVLSQTDVKKGEADMKAAATAVGDMAKAGKTDPKLDEAVWAAFSVVRSSQTRELAKAARDAVLAVKSPSYGPKCVAKLAVPVDDKKGGDDSHDQLTYWQPTCLELVKELKFAPAARAVVGVLLSPAKKPLGSLAQSILLTMPVEAEPPLAAALTGTDAELAQLESTWDAKGYVAVSADALGWLGRPLGARAAMAALSVADNDANRAKIAETLPRYPASQALVGSFTAVYGKISGAQAAPPPAKPAQGATTAPPSVEPSSPHLPLLVVAPYFFDTSLTDWLLKSLASAEGREKQATALVSLVSAIELMAPKQVPAVTAAVAQYGTSRETAMLKAATEVTKKCGTDADCYTKVLDEPIAPGPQGDTAAVKAAIMAGVYGTVATRAELVKRVDHVKDGGVRLALAEAILHLAPAGDPAAADALDRAVAREHAAATPDGAIVEKVAKMLRGRALP